MVFDVPVATYISVNGHRYHAKPQLIAVDVRSADVVSLFGKARPAQQDEIGRLNGYRSRA